MRYGFRKQSNRFKMGVVVLWIGILMASFLAGCGKTEVEADTWGRSDAKEIDVNSKIPGRIVKLLVKEGDMVKAGQVVAIVDKKDIEAKKAEVEANILALQAQQMQASTATALQEGITSSDTMLAQTQVSQAAAALDNAKADYDRFSVLAAEGAISRQAFGAMETKYKVAQETYKQALAGQQKAHSATKQVEVQAANEAALAQKVVAARAILEQMENALEETEIKAPFDGIVTAKYVEEGSMISQGTPVVAVQDPTDNWVDFKVPETKLSQYQVHQKLVLEARDGKTKVEGTIIDISKKAEFATQRATSERGDSTDIITFNVKVQVNSDILRPGMRFKVVSGL